MKHPLNIIFEDDDLIVLNKPPLLLTIPDRYSPEKPNLYHLLTKKYGKVYIVHRLDKETSGIIMFAKNAPAHATLSKAFQHRLVKKTYLALIEGKMVKDEVTIDKALSPSKSKWNKMVIDPKGKKSITIVKVLERFKRHTLLEADIQTGRLHQIRIHLASIGHPLAIDFLYGQNTEFLLSSIKKSGYNLGNDQTERPLMTRTTLHAHSLSFVHPTSQEALQFQAEPPKDFAAVLKQLRKWG